MLDKGLLGLCIPRTEVIEIGDLFICLTETIELVYLITYDTQLRGSI